MSGEFDPTSEVGQHSTDYDRDNDKGHCTYPNSCFYQGLGGLACACPDPCDYWKEDDD